MPVSEAKFLKLALEDPGRWELFCGELVERPGMTYEHNDVAMKLLGWLYQQLDGTLFRIRSQVGHVNRTELNYFIPDVFVVPIDLAREQQGTRRLEAYSAPLPLVVEIWSPTTGSYDINVKLTEYQRRGDLEIWRIHPYDRTLTAWRRQPDGSYSETEHTTGSVRPAFLPNVTIDLDRLFAD